MDKIKKIGQDLSNGWKNLDRNKRIRLAVIVSLLVLFVMATTWWIQKTDYAVLFSDLDPADAGQITENLDSQGMKYKLENNGTTILIDQKYIDKYRINLAVEGLLPENSTGFEIFDNTSMMATDEDRQIMYQRAIQGELERSIASLASVKSAKVLLSLPEDSIFQNPDYQKEATASIKLETVGTKPLSAQTVQGIASLVSGAVERLPIANIQIIDSRGNLLSRSLQQTGDVYASDIVSQKQEIQRDYELKMEQKILSLLAPIYGVEKVQVSVYAELNFDAEEEESTEYGENSIRSEQESVSGNNDLVSDVKEGTLDDNASTVIEQGGGENGNSYDRTTNYELDSINKKKVIAPGDPRNLTASVVIKGNRIDTINDKELVETAMGGIGLASVQYVPDIPAVPPSLIPDGELTGKLLTFLKSYWMFLVAIVLLLVIAGILIRRSKKRAEFDEWDAFDELEEEEDNTETEENPELEAITQAAQEWKEKEKANAEQQQIVDEKEAEVRKYAGENPELASELIKIWMNEKKV